MEYWFLCLFTIYFFAYLLSKGIPVRWSWGGTDPFAAYQPKFFSKLSTKNMKSEEKNFRWTGRPRSNTDLTKNTQNFGEKTVHYKKGCPFESELQ